jgi:hypothetical protein
MVSDVTIKVFWFYRTFGKKGHGHGAGDCVCSPTNDIITPQQA